MSYMDKFRFRLARELNKSLAEIDEMPYNEFIQWLEYSKIEPFGVERNEMMIAQLSALIFNLELRKSKSKERREALDFLISIDEETKKEIKQTRLNDGLMNFMRGFKDGSR